MIARTVSFESVIVFIHMNEAVQNLSTFQFLPQMLSRFLQPEDSPLICHYSFYFIYVFIFFLLLKFEQLEERVQILMFLLLPQ